jgi:proline dehydrogenase
VLGRAVLLKLADSPRVERVVRRNKMSAALVRRFVAGETLEQTAQAVRALNAQGLSATLDYLGENVHSSEQAAECADRVCDTLRFIGRESLRSGVSVKLTQLGLDISDEICERHTRRIVDLAADLKRFVRIDMEGSPYTQRTLDLFCRLLPDHPNVGIVVQSYLRRTDADLERLIDLGASVRLVKGAYQEPPEIAYPSKRDVDAAYLAQMKRLLDRGRQPAIATHDERIVQATRAYARERNRSVDEFEFQMLFGIRRDLQNALVHAGYRVRIYTPFGSEWYGYTMRRLAERPANLWFVMKNLLRS